MSHDRRETGGRQIRQATLIMQSACSCRHPAPRRPAPTLLLPPLPPLPGFPAWPSSASSSKASTQRSPAGDLQTCSRLMMTRQGCFPIWRGHPCFSVSARPSQAWLSPAAGTLSALLLTCRETEQPAASETPLLSLRHRRRRGAADETEAPADERTACQPRGPAGAGAAALPGGLPGAAWPGHPAGERRAASRDACMLRARPGTRSPAGEGCRRPASNADLPAGVPTGGSRSAARLCGPGIPKPRQLERLALARGRGKQPGGPATEAANG
jgi:hypothetical protein